MFSVLKKSLVWADVWELALSWWRMIRLRRLVALTFPKTSGKQIVVYHSELIVRRCTNDTVAACHKVFRKKQVTICFEVLHARTTFGGFCLSWKTHTVDCRLLSGSHAEIHDSSPVTIPQACFEASLPYFFSISLDQSTLASFWAFVKLCGIQREHIYLTAKFSFNIQCMLVPLKSKDVSISR